MRRILLVLTRPLEASDESVIAAERTLPNTRVEVVDLSVEQPDYRAMLRAVFEAESVQIW